MSTIRFILKGIESTLSNVSSTLQQINVSSSKELKGESRHYRQDKPYHEVSSSKELKDFKPPLSLSSV